MKCDAGIYAESMQSLEHLAVSWRCNSDSSKASTMQAYMKQHFLFIGIPTPQRRDLSKSILTESKACTIVQLFDHTLRLFDLPEREFHYLAIDLLAHNQSRFGAEQVPDLLKLVTLKSWWDSVDGLISVLEKVLLRLPADQVEALMLPCLKHENKWLRRVAMLHQKSWKKATVEARLFEYALVLAADSDFFIRKAIAWALREYAKTSPVTVLNFLEQNHSKFSLLTRREASKHLIRSD